MATFDQSYRLSQDTALRDRLAIALVRKADFVRIESQNGMSATKIAKRQALALQARNAPEALVPTFARQIAINGVLSNDGTLLANIAYGINGAPGGTASPNSTLITDSQLATNIDTVWDAVSGVDNAGA